MLLMSTYVVPLPLGQEGAKATSSVARMAVPFAGTSEGAPEAEVTMDLTVRVSLFVDPSVVVESLAALICPSLVD